jgi:hypothetical protein
MPHVVAERPMAHTKQRIAAARYVASMAGDLAQIAQQHGLDTLGYILEMAKLEAENEAREPL